MVDDRSEPVCGLCIGPRPAQRFGARRRRTALACPGPYAGLRWTSPVRTFTFDRAAEPRAIARRHPERVGSLAFDELPADAGDHALLDAYVSLIGFDVSAVRSTMIPFAVVRWRVIGPTGESLLPLGGVRTGGMPPSGWPSMSVPRDGAYYSRIPMTEADEQYRRFANMQALRTDSARLEDCVDRVLRAAATSIAQEMSLP